MVYGIIGVLFVILIGIVLMDSNRFHTVRYQLRSKKLKQKHTVVFLSDLHGKQYGKQNKKLLRAIRKLQPEAILIGGDLLTARPNRSFTSSLELLDELMADFPIYYANGNHEHRLELYPEIYGDMAQRYEEQLKKRGLKRIRNDKANLFDGEIIVFGCEIEREYYKRFKQTPMPDSYLTALLPSRNEEDFTILMAHNPNYFESYAKWGADLVLSGHVHGGVARIPFLGGVISPDLKLFPKYDGGLFRIGHSQMILSRGLGAHTIPFRFLNPGELIVIELLPEE